MGTSESRIQLNSEPENENNNAVKKGQHTKVVVVNLIDIERKMEFDLSLNNISFENFAKEFEKAINLPSDVQPSYYTINSITGSSEVIENDYVICNINKDIVFEVTNRGSKTKIIDITLTIIDDQQVYCQTTKTFNFLTLKQSLLFLTEKKKPYRVFQSMDTLLEDPLDLNLTLSDLRITEDEIILVVYLINPKDLVKVLISDNQDTVKFDVDKYMRISELTELYNAECKKFNVICDFQLGVKLYERHTIEKIRDGRKSLNLSGMAFDIYYKRPVDAPKVNPLDNDDVKTNFLDIPD